MTSIKVTTPQVITPAVIDLPTYQYGQSQQELDAEVALRNLPTGGASTKIGTVTLSAATGSTAVTGVGFTPTVVYLICANGNNAGASWGFGDGTNNYSIGQAGSGGIIVNTSKAINVLDVSYPSDFQGTISSMDSDGFTINIDYQTGTPTLKVIYLAIG